MTELITRLLEIRIGKLPPAELYKERLGSWPADIPSAYWKDSIEEVEIGPGGLVGKEIGQPSHIQYENDRAVLITHLLQCA
jgi:hypothetical protein